MEIDDLRPLGEEQVTRQADLKDEKNLPAPMQPGEDPGSPLFEDAIHWVSVYGELVQFTQVLVEQVGATIRSIPSLALSPVFSHDVDQLTAELKRLKIHLAFWRERIRSGPP